MSELSELVKQQSEKIERLEKVVDSLCKLIMKDKVDTTWLTEEVAAETLGLQPRTLRMYVKAGKIDVDFRHTNGRSYQYSRKGIMEFKKNTSSSLRVA